MSRTAAVSLAIVAAVGLGLAFAASSSATGGDVDESLMPVAEDGFEYCGDVKPVFKNPDLQPRDDGYVHASGWFFIQFQVIETNDTDVDRLSFSFGKPAPDQARTCDTPEWITDAYYKDYRVDDDPSDGFFIPINTTNVPDGTYAAAVSVYAGGEEVGRMFTRAVVENGCPLGERGPDCDQATVAENDEVKPWPVVLPGDGEQVHDVDGLTIEFAEAIDEVSAEIAPSPNAPSEEIQLEEMEPRAWDEDSIFAPADEDAPACPACAENSWGPAYKWEGPIGEDAVVTVTATDLAGNEATKIIHMASTAAGGVIDVQLPELDVKIPEPKQSAGPGEETRFEVVLQNVGRDTAHVNLRVNDTEEVDTYWEPNHVAVDGGEEATAELVASSSTAGEHSIEAFASYKRGAEDVREPIPLTLTVEGASAEEPASNDTDDGEQLNATAGGEDAEEDDNGIPFPGAAFVAVAMAAVAVARRRG